MPDASHSFGYMLIDVKPGMVLISFIHSSPVSRSSRKSHGQPGGVNGLEARHCEFSHLLGEALIKRADEKLALSSRYLSLYE